MLAEQELRELSLAEQEVQVPSIADQTAEQANGQDDRRLGHTDATAARKGSRSDTAPSEGTTVDEMEKAVAREYHLNQPNSEPRRATERSATPTPVFPPAPAPVVVQPLTTVLRPDHVDRKTTAAVSTTPAPVSSHKPPAVVAGVKQPQPACVLTPAPRITPLMEQLEALSLEDDRMDVDEDWGFCFHPASPSVHQEYDYMDIDEDF
jgi:hypothetical protein